MGLLDYWALAERLERGMELTPSECDDMEALALELGLSPHGATNVAVDNKSKAI